MDNKKLGVILILVCVILGVLIFTLNDQLNSQAELGCTCTAMDEGGSCPHEDQNPWQTYVAVILIAGVAALGVYLIFFEKSQKEIISTLEKQKQIQTSEEKLEILLKGLNSDEQRVIKAVKEQDGIAQNTLRLRTDLHKSKLSIVLDVLEKKGLIKKVPDGKTNRVYLKIGL